MEKRIQSYIILGFYFVCGLILGVLLSQDPPRKPHSVTVDIVKNSDEILIYEHDSENLIFEYSKDKEVDKNAYKEFEEAWKETRSLK